MWQSQKKNTFRESNTADLEYLKPNDKNILPDSAEIARLKEIDPNLILRLMERFDKEQDARHNFTSRKLALVNSEQNRLFKIDVLTIVCAFLSMSGGMFLSYTLLREGHTIAGSIFGGSTLFLAANAFLSFRKKAA